MYCENCGKQIDDKAEICVGCGTRTVHHIDNPSNLWYLLPLFVGMIGGILGYIFLKDKNRYMAKNVLIVGIVISILGFLSFSSGTGTVIKVSGTTGLEFSGAYGGLGSMKSVDGTIPEEYTVSSGIVSASFQKQEEYGTIKVEIIKNGRVVASESTDAKYGVVVVSSR